ncbi:response regulator [Tenacibaculum xiamenense]|uniref:response regulator n=1 Tax=Tenacibaculum xiamenense TaxID=1261553 RepID=UPI003894840A
MNVNIAIADDHQIIIDGIKALLQNEKQYKIIAEASNGQELINEAIPLMPDLILMDIGMPIMDGISATRKIKKEHPGIKILILTTYADPKRIKEMLKIGVDGYILKDSGKDNFITAIQTIMQGKTYYDSRITEIMMDSFNKKKSIAKTPTPLTQREKEIIRLISEGMNTKQIANTLFLSLLTVETHRKNIYTKLGLNKVATLVRYAVEEGIVV